MTDKKKRQKDSALWTSLTPQDVAGENETYYRLLFDQYATYVATTDAIARAKLQTNAFFLTLHTGLLAGIALVLSEQSSAFLFGAGFLGIASGAVLSVVWAKLLRSYRAVSRAKFEVIGELEQRLPASPLWGAEWQKLTTPGSGYASVTRMETWIPWLVVGVYLLVLAYAAAFTLSPGLRSLLSL